MKPTCPVVIAPGMTVVEVTDAIPATIVAFTEAYCICRSDETDSLAVSPWRELALTNICPARPLLPSDVQSNDERNARAVLLRELLALREFGLTAAEEATLAELIERFGGAAADCTSSE